ncbi:hypothetical protein Tco_0037836 [Tanacetum coccineum]
MGEFGELKWGLKWVGLGGETGTETWVELGGFGGEMVALGVDLGVEIEVKVGLEAEMGAATCGFRGWNG